MTADIRSRLVFVGSQTDAIHGGVFGGLGEGVYAFRLDSPDLPLTPLGVAALPDPTFLAVSRTRNVVYAASHSVRFEGEPGAGVTAFRIDADGSMMRINSQRVAHPHVTMIALDRQEQFLFAASSLGGAVSVLPVDPDGSIQPVVEVARFDGDILVAVGETPQPVPLPGRPGRTITAIPVYGPTTMPHCICATGDELIVADIGSNAIERLTFDRATGRLWRKSRLTLSRRAGPRMLALHPNGDLFYSINELDCTVSAFVFSRQSSAIQEVQVISTLPDGASGGQTAGGLVIHPSGRFLWATNRVHNSIACFDVGPSGTLQHSGVLPSGGAFPIHLNLTPDGAHLYVSNAHSGQLCAFAIDAFTGELTAKATTEVPGTCAVFLETAGRIPPGPGL